MGEPVGERAASVVDTQLQHEQSYRDRENAVGEALARLVVNPSVGLNEWRGGVDVREVVVTRET